MATKPDGPEQKQRIGLSISSAPLDCSFASQLLPSPRSPSPTLPGSYSQQWTLSTSPLLPDWRPLTVTARGLCLPEDCTSVERAALEEDVREKEKMAKVRA